MSVGDQSLSGRVPEDRFQDEAELAALEREVAEQVRQLAQLREQVGAEAARAALLEQERRATEAKAAEALLQQERVQAELIRAERRQASADRMRAQAEAELAQLQAAHQLVVSSTIWRSSQPVRRLAAAMSPRLRRALRSGLRLGWWTVTLRLRERKRLSEEAAVALPSGDDDPSSLPALTVEHGLRRRFPAIEALRTYPDRSTGRRLSIVTDSISPGYLYGGVGTAMIFAGLLARRLGADLRLITRSHDADPAQVGTFLRSFGIPWDREVTCVLSPTGAGTGADVPVSAGDVFLTTSWWTTQATRQAVDPSRILYLLQEDERMFYPHGDDRLRCAELLASGDIRFVVNTEMLFRHLTEGDAALPNVARQGCWFEPAFPGDTYYDDAQDRASRRVKNFMFYARPGNLRNLYWRGLEAIAAAMEAGSLRPEEWRFTFVGRDLRPVLLPFDTRPRLLENLPWADYAALIRETDLGLSLIDTPHPSYPPLDLAASGAVAVTNQCGLKTSLAQYSRNILCVPSTVDGLRQGLAEGEALVADAPRREANLANGGIRRDWAETLEPALRRCAEWLG